MKKSPVKVSVESGSFSTPRPILFLALDDVLCHGTPYGLADALEIMRQHKRVTDRGLLRRSPYFWDTLFAVSSLCRLENLREADDWPSWPGYSRPAGAFLRLARSSLT